MNQCIINIIEKSVFVAFTQIVEKGSIEVWNLKGDEEPIIIQDVLRTNFESINLQLEKGKYKLEITMDGKRISKTISII